VHSSPLFHTVAMLLRIIDVICPTPRDAVMLSTVFLR
jgi:hypothetical protein